MNDEAFIARIQASISVMSPCTRIDDSPRVKLPWMCERTSNCSPNVKIPDAIIHSIIWRESEKPKYEIDTAWQF